MQVSAIINTNVNNLLDDKNKNNENNLNHCIDNLINSSPNLTDI